MDKTKVYHYSQVNAQSVMVDKAGAAIDDVRCRMVKFDTNGALVLCAAGEAPLGVAIITNAAETKTGENVHVQIRDNGLIQAGAAFAKGAVLASDANGKAVTATAGAATIGIALEAAAADGEVVRFILTRGVAASS